AIGPGTALSPDDVNLVMATVSGAVRLDSNGRVTIDNTYLIKGDVDLSTGNVDFEGSVVINQDVRRGFTIRASGDVEVKGSIEEARVIAGGSIIARGGILGGASNASLQAGQDILARFANNATLIAGHDVILGQEAVNCGIEAEGRVVVGGKVPTKGFIRGGTVRAAKEISAYTIGTTRGAKTKLEVGYAWLLPRKLQSLEAELIHRQAQLEKTTARLRELLSERAMKELPTGKRIMLEKLRLAEEALRLTVRTLDNRRQMWLKAAQTKGTILAHGTAHSGVELTVDGCTRVLEEERQKEQFINESGKVIGLAIKGTG
ncbi:MAG: DUF342 domain-containing protein, partial [Chloroflexota bacterium]|nr:DUF342 domain-containing protein [Chloroflexota bacterium]